MGCRDDWSNRPCWVPVWLLIVMVGSGDGSLPVISCCCCFIAKSCLTLYDPMDCSSMPDSPVLHCLPVCSNSCLLSQWCYLTISSSAAPFSCCLQPFAISGLFPTSQIFTSGGQSIGASASVSALPMTIQGWFPLGSIGLISLQSKGLIVSNFFLLWATTNLFEHIFLFTCSVSCNKFLKTNCYVKVHMHFE